MTRFELDHRPAEERVDVLADGALFTAYQYPSDEPVVQKPVLAPINTAGGTAVTRGYPLTPREGERVDHPHHVGAFFAYGEDPGVDGVGFWNVSEPVAPDDRRYGRIVHEAVTETTETDDIATLGVRARWERGDGERLLVERTRFRFAGEGDRRRIDRTTTLEAVTSDVPMPDDKEGLFALRVARELEHPDAGAPDRVVGPDGESVPATQATEVEPTGEYVNAAGTRGTGVWGTRSPWMRLTGTLSDGDTVAVTIMDHPANPGHPTYWHARGYGLFAANPLGQAVFSDGEERLDFVIPEGEAETFQYRMEIERDAPSADELDRRHRTFAEAD